MSGCDTSVAGRNSFEDGTALQTSWIPLPAVIGGSAIEVSVEGKTFTVSKDLLCRHSSYFKAALNGGFLEAMTNTIHLDDRLDLFQIFHTWLYKEDLNFLGMEKPVPDMAKCQIAYVELYCFADRRGVPVMGNQVIELFDKLIRPKGLPVRAEIETIKLAWAQLPNTCGLCRYLVAVERDANRCHLPRRAPYEYDWLPGGFISDLLNLTEDDSDYELVASIQKQPVDITRLNGVVNKFGTGILCGRVCRAIVIRAPRGSDEHQMREKMWRLYEKYLGAYDNSLTESHKAALEKQSPRPFAKEYFHTALVGLENKARALNRPSRHEDRAWRDGLFGDDI